jgi:twitching motility protein PilT
MALELDLATLLLFTKQVGGSDLHVSAGAPVMVRVHGEMRRLEVVDGPQPPSRADEVRELVYALLTEDQRKELETEKELDLAVSLGAGGRFRANVFFHDRGVGAAFRVIPTRVQTCEELGMPPAVQGLAELREGLVLFVGASGTGKSTSMAAIVDRVVSTRRGHVITIEEPIEFVHEPRLSMVTQRSVGLHTRAFASALRAALRENPDVILVGEMRDLETIALAIKAAETGHLVLATLHTPSASKTIERIINVFPPAEQGQVRMLLADTLRAVVAQMLLPRGDGQGRVAAHEVLLVTAAARAMIRDGKTHELPTVIQTGGQHGMTTFEQAIERLAREAVIDREVAARALEAVQPDRRAGRAP